MGKKKEGKKKTEIEKIDYVNTTPKGEKKDTSQEMLSEYHPIVAESAWYDWWVNRGFFTANNQETSKEKYVIMLPPPNVTGSLHIGHALTGAIEDTLARWNRMSGKSVLYLPGVDHAGIATQVVVEKKLQKEKNLSRHDLGREKFLEHVWQWKEQYGSRIYNQLSRIGSSLDWSRQCFTMDDKLSHAVREAFVRMFEKGYIYRATKLVNWCCSLRTAISNIEVDHEEVIQKRIAVPGHDGKKYDFGYIWSFAYMVDGTPDKLVISTTRPETMLGDTAIAVHPDDPRYKHLHGKYVIHPFCNRKIPIVLDPVLVDMNFGTGAVKITPAHDYNDFECGKRHNLPFINIFNDDGTINENGGPFAGMKRFDAREAVLKALEEKGLFVEKLPHKLMLGFCQRSKDVIEPFIKPQWFVDCTELAKEALKASETGELNIIPSSEKKTWARWLENIQDWCISRQLWWGHRIPAYSIKYNGSFVLDPENPHSEKNWVVARTEEEARKIAVKKVSEVIQTYDDKLLQLEQDEDVLDTWFSSGLFPFSTLGWPNEDDPDFKSFYPNQLLETGVDILFFWVARMVMMGIALTGKLPFKDVFLHSIVRDKDGKKMAKSLGNVIDPVDVIEGISLSNLQANLNNTNLSMDAIEKAKKLQEKQFPDGIPECGTDALRFSLLNYTAQANINLDVMRVFGYRTFCNKLWNLTKFALLNIKSLQLQTANEIPLISNSSTDYSFADRWILSRLHYTIKDVVAALKAYDFGRYTDRMYRFFLYELCDVYVELSKAISSSSSPAKQRAAHLTLYTCLEHGFKLLHPAMPFITEELWQRLPGRDLLPKDKDSICVNNFPNPADYQWYDEHIEKDMNFVLDVVKAIRGIKSSYNLTNKQKPDVYLKSSSEPLKKLLQQEISDIQRLTYCGNIHIQDEIPLGCAVEILSADTCEVHVLLMGWIDFNAELAKVQKQIQEKKKQHDTLEKKTLTPNYSKVPEKVKQENAAKLESLKIEIEKLEKGVISLKKVISSQ